MFIPTTTLTQGASSSLLELIHDETLAGTQASFDIQSIPGTYAHLRLLAVLRTDAAVTFENSIVRFNNDSAANYDSGRGVINADTAAGLTTAGATSVGTMRNTGASATAGRFSAWDLTIPDYAGTTAQKNILGTDALFATTAEANMVIQFSAGQWRDTSAITRITIAPGSGSWIAGCRVTLYGIGV